MRYDVAYLGKVRKVVDGKGRDVVSFRYDRMSGRPTRIRDFLGNDRLFEWDASGRLSRQSRRAADSPAVEPVRSFFRDKAGNAVAVAELDADGKAVRTTVLSYDGERRPVRFSDGRREVRIEYTKFGRPCRVVDGLGRVLSLSYDRWNRLVSVTSPDGVETTASYTPFGRIASIARQAGEELFQSVTVDYDGMGLPVSYTDQDGRRKRLERDDFGRVVKEMLPDSSSVAYSYDDLGRLTSVLDENGHEIKFGWGDFGLKSRETAAGQLTDFVRDDWGLLKSTASSKDGKTDRMVKRERDRFDRVVKVTYGPGETETFAYDAWGRVSRHTRGKKAETYSYDHFGRLVGKCEDGVATAYAYDAWGRRVRRTVKDSNGEVVSDETRAYDAAGRLASIKMDGQSVEWRYDRLDRVERQIVDGREIVYSYTKHGRLSTKTLMGENGPVSELRYWYGKDGRIVARRANGELRKFFYDARGPLARVSDEEGNVLEDYIYDAAGNILEKIVRGRKTRYEYDAANQLVSSVDADGLETRYAYDAAGRMVKEGARTYRYGYLDKVLAVADGKERRTFTYHVDGQLATATKTVLGGPQSSVAATETEVFLWDGLALVRRGSTSYLNEPHPGGGAAVSSSSGGVMFNDILGTTLGVAGNDGYSPVTTTAFGDMAPKEGPGPRGPPDALFTGKPHVEGLGYAFLFRNYRAGLGKWLSADPLGYPDGWNQTAYCRNEVIGYVDIWGCAEKPIGTIEPYDNPNIMNEIASVTLHGGTVSYDTEGYDIIDRLDSEDLLYLFHKPHELWGHYKQIWYLETWKIINVTATFTKETIISTLLKYVGNAGEAAAIIALFTKFTALGTGATIAQLIAAFQESTQTTYSTQLGKIKELIDSKRHIEYFDKFIRKIE